MKINESKIRQIIREESRALLGESDSVKGATFHKDPVTGKWVTGGEDFPGEGGRAAMRTKEPKILSVGNPDFLKRKFESENPNYFSDEYESQDEDPNFFDDGSDESEYDSTLDGHNEEMDYRGMEDLTGAYDDLINDGYSKQDILDFIIKHL